MPKRRRRLGGNYQRGNDGNNTKQGPILLILVSLILSSFKEGWDWGRGGEGVILAHFFVFPYMPT